MNEIYIAIYNWEQSLSRKHYTYTGFHSSLCKINAEWGRQTKSLASILARDKRYFFYPDSIQALVPMLCPIQWIYAAHPPGVKHLFRLTFSIGRYRGFTELSIFHGIVIPTECSVCL
jgi:hypothetical protein